MLKKSRKKVGMIYDFSSDPDPLFHEVDRDPDQN